VGARLQGGDVVVAVQVGGVAQVDVTGPAERRQAEAERRDGQAGRPEQARRETSTGRPTRP
jgi:hypothetical protein